MQGALMYYSGIDLHRDNCFITTVNESGTIVKQQRVHNSEVLVLNYFQSLGDSHRTVVESTTGWYWLNDLLESHNIPMTLAHAKYLKAISYAKVKTDKVDSHTLATLLRLNLIPAAHKISRELRGLRDTMRMRLRLVQQRTACYRRIESILAKFNTPENVPDQYKFQSDAVQQIVQSLTDQILTLEKSLHPVLVPNSDIQHLFYIPGIGKITAFSLYLEIDGIERFGSVKQFLSYCRLVPAALNSNRRIHQRSSKDGNKYLKIAFSDASVHAVQYYPEFKAFYNKMLRRTNKAIAYTIVAKELAKIVYFILKNHSPYKGFKGLPISRQKSLQWPRLLSPDA